MLHLIASFVCFFSEFDPKSFSKTFAIYYSSSPVTIGLILEIVRRIVCSIISGKTYVHRSTTAAKISQWMKIGDKVLFRFPCSIFSAWFDFHIAVAQGFSTPLLSRNILVSCTQHNPYRIYSIEYGTNYEKLFICIAHEQIMIFETHFPKTNEPIAKMKNSSAVFVVIFHRNHS